MSQTQQATAGAIEECKQMTKRMSDIIAERGVQQKHFDDKMLEYQRRKGLRDMALIDYNRYCSGDCAFGGVQKKGCNPMCTNWVYLNPEPIPPAAPVFPDLGAFACTICTQNVDLKALASKDVNIARKALQQQMSCVTNLEAKQTSSQTETEISKPVQASEQKPDISRTQWIIISIIIFVVLAAIITTIVWLATRSSDVEGGDLRDDWW